MLRVVLELYPGASTLDELIREWTGGGSKEFQQVDAVQRALRALAADGLLHRPGADEGPSYHGRRPLLRADGGEE